MNLGEFILLVVILAAILAFIGVPWWLSRRRASDDWQPSGAYLGAIDALIRGNRTAATTHLRELAQHQAENVGAYIRLGDLVRTIGYPERAYRIHADLLAREIENADDLRRVHESLIEDLLLLDRPEEAKLSADKLLATDKKNLSGLRAMVRFYEHEGDWEKALDQLDHLDEILPGRSHPTPAQMRIQIARVHLDQNRPREAKKILEEAVRMTGDGAVALVFLGDLLALEGELERACEQWIEYVKDYGFRSEQVFSRLERAYFEMGRFGDLIQVYEGIAASGSGNIHASVALAEMHRRRGRIDEAIRHLETVLETEPDHRGARRQLISNLLQIGRTEQALRELDTLLAETTEAPNTGVCGSCGESSDDLWVRCERCGAWQEAAAPTPAPRPRPVPVPHAD